MSYITRTLRFEDGEWDQSILKEQGYGNWRVVAVLSMHEARPDSPRIEYVRCLIEDRT